MPPELKPADAVRWIGDRVTELVAGFAELPLDRLVDLGHRLLHPWARGQTGATGRTADDDVRARSVSARSGSGSTRSATSYRDPAVPPHRPATRHRRAAAGRPAVFAPGRDRASPSRPPRPSCCAIRPGGVPAGRYHGLVLASGVADAVVPITR